MSILVFEDSGVSRLHPLTVGRPAFALSCGAVRLIDRLLALGMPVQAVARPHLLSLIEEDYPQIRNSAREPSTASAVLCVNARLVPSRIALRTLQTVWDRQEPCQLKQGDAVVAALLSPGTLATEAEMTAVGLSAHLEQLTLSTVEHDLALFEYPHDVVRHHMLNLDENLQEKLQQGDYRELADGLFVHGDVTLGDYVVTETTDGPILLEAGVQVGPHSYLQGPLHVGQGARILEHAAIKELTALGHTTKIGGEVECSIVEPYSNKQHHGFLGHSCLGSWINLGAGTCTSDLKNTYGTVKMDYGGERVSTDMQFVGVMMGDYAKSAINTGFFTGKTVGVCSMVYGFVTTNVPSFVNYARLFGQVTATPVEVMVSTQKRMFARRGVEQRPCDIQLLHDMFELTSNERQLGSVPLEPLSL